MIFLRFLRLFAANPSAELQLMAIAAKQNVECGKLESGKKSPG